MHLKQNMDATIFYVTTSSLRLGKIKAGNLTTNWPRLSLVIYGMLIIPEKWSEKNTSNCLFLVVGVKTCSQPTRKQRFFASFQVHPTAPLSPKRRYVSSINAWASKRNMCSLVQLNTMEMSHKPMSRYKCSNDNIDMINFKQQILHTTFPPNQKITENLALGLADVSQWFQRLLWQLGSYVCYNVGSPLAGSQTCIYMEVN